MALFTFEEYNNAIPVKDNDQSCGKLVLSDLILFPVLFFLI